MPVAPLVSPSKRSFGRGKVGLKAAPPAGLPRLRCAVGHGSADGVRRRPSCSGRSSSRRHSAPSRSSGSASTARPTQNRFGTAVASPMIEIVSRGRDGRQPNDGSRLPSQLPRRCGDIAERRTREGYPRAAPVVRGRRDAAHAPPRCVLTLRCPPRNVDPTFDPVGTHGVGRQNAFAIPGCQKNAHARGERVRISEVRTTCVCRWGPFQATGS